MAYTGDYDSGSQNGGSGDKFPEPPFVEMTTAGNPAKVGIGSKYAAGTTGLANDNQQQSKQRNAAIEAGDNVVRLF